MHTDKLKTGYATKEDRKGWDRIWKKKKING